MTRSIGRRFARGHAPEQSKNERTDHELRKPDFFTS